MDCRKCRYYGEKGRGTPGDPSDFIYSVVFYRYASFEAMITNAGHVKSDLNAEVHPSEMAFSTVTDTITWNRSRYEYFLVQY